MNLNKLPVLVRTEVTAAAAKGVSMPAVYSRALVVLNECVEELSFAKLKSVEISVEGLAAWAKATQDTKLTEQARELKFRARRTANYIAEKLVAQRRAAFVARGGRTNRGRVPAGEPESGGVKDALRRAGYSVSETNTIQVVSQLPDNSKNAQLGYTALRSQTRVISKRRGIKSAVYDGMFGNVESPFRRKYWFRNNNARGIARQVTDPIEVEKARQEVTFVRAWCDEFLKNLPRTVSKGKT